MLVTFACDTCVWRLMQSRLLRAKRPMMCLTRLLRVPPRSDGFFPRHCFPTFTHTTLSHTILHTTFHTLSFTHNFHTHTHHLSHTALSHTHTPSFFVTQHLSYTTLSYTIFSCRSSITSFVFPSFPVPPTRFVDHYWKKLTCGVIRSFNFVLKFNPKHHRRIDRTIYNV